MPRRSARMRDLGFGRRVGAVDRCDLVGMDCEATTKPSRRERRQSRSNPSESQNPYTPIDGHDLGGGGCETGKRRVRTDKERSRTRPALVTRRPSADERSSAPQVRAISRGCAGAYEPSANIAFAVSVATARQLTEPAPCRLLLQARRDSAHTLEFGRAVEPLG